MRLVNKVKDLSVNCYPHLTFHDHTRERVRLLYNALVRSKLEYNTLVWNPPEKCYILVIEKCNKHFCDSSLKKSIVTTPSCSLLDDSSWTR
jgi:hypothetical protein